MSEHEFAIGERVVSVHPNHVGTGVVVPDTVGVAGNSVSVLLDAPAAQSERVKYWYLARENLIPYATIKGDCAVAAWGDPKGPTLEEVLEKGLNLLQKRLRGLRAIERREVFFPCMRPGCRKSSPHKTRLK